MAFDGSGNKIELPENFLGVVPFEQTNGSVRNGFDRAHGYGDSKWNRDMVDQYQDILDPGGHFQFNPDARYNGAAIAKRTVDNGVVRQENWIGQDFGK